MASTGRPEHARDRDAGGRDLSVATTAPQVLVSRNPATGQPLGSVKIASTEDVAAVCRRAAEVQGTWAKWPAGERAAVVNRAADFILYNAPDYADLVRRENGKPRSDAVLMEVGPTIDGFRWVARRAPRILADEWLRPNLLTFVHGMWHRIRREPLGVIGIISPSNYPLSIPAGVVASALAAGNGVVLKPSPLAPLTAERLAEAFTAAGLPDGLFGLVHGSGEQGHAVCTSPHVSKVVFTGSVEVGRLVAQACADQAKPYTLELGGKDPAIVRTDADLDRSVPQILWTACANSGQSCARVARVYVHRSIHDEFVARLVEQASALVVGDPADPDVDMGPLLDPAHWERVCALVDDAVAKGATLLVGGPHKANGPGCYYRPTVLTGVSQSMRLLQEETFGPVIPVMAFDDDDEAVRLANDSRYGLGASIWTRDRPAARAMAARIQAGMVWINEHLYSHAAPMTPWLGVKDSGIGVVHSKYGLQAMTRPKLLSTNFGPLPPALFPHNAALEAATFTMLNVFTARGIGRRLGTAWRNRSDVVEYVRHRARVVRRQADRYGSS
ncbi:MAG: aldehyde dehydrogenase family protein [Actinomycetota bacterium]|nr:aldehyde dehydrogenase family protein [Actinomycetota bacterium]